MSFIRVSHVRLAASWDVSAAHIDVADDVSPVDGIDQESTALCVAAVNTTSMDLYTSCDLCRHALPSTKEMLQPASAFYSAHNISQDQFRSEVVSNVKTLKPLVHVFCDLTSITTAELLGRGSAAELLSVVSRLPVNACVSDLSLDTAAFTLLRLFEAGLEPAHLPQDVLLVVLCSRGVKTASTAGSGCSVCACDRPTSAKDPLYLDAAGPQATC